MSFGQPNSKDHGINTIQSQQFLNYCTNHPNSEVPSSLDKQSCYGSNSLPTKSISRSEPDYLDPSHLGVTSPLSSVANETQFPESSSSDMYCLHGTQPHSSKPFPGQEHPDNLGFQVPQSSQMLAQESLSSSENVQLFPDSVESPLSQWVRSPSEYQQCQTSASQSHQQSSPFQVQNLSSLNQPPHSYHLSSTCPVSASQNAVALHNSMHQLFSPNVKESVSNSQSGRDLTQILSPLPPDSSTASLRSQQYILPPDTSTNYSRSPPQMAHTEPLPQLSTSSGCQDQTYPQAYPVCSQPLNSQYLPSNSQTRHPQMVQRRTLAPQVLHDQQRFGSFSRQHSSDRAPGKALSAEEWNALNCAVSLLHDSNFLPTDGPEKPRRPNLPTQVNCHPDYMRCTLTTVPVSNKLQSKCRMPLGLLVHPFRDVIDLPVIQTPVIARCRSCRTYINPFVKFVDNGRRWRCPVCLLLNVVPEDFFFDPATKTYGDPSRRPEVRSATVEFIAPSEYMVRPPQAPTYVFCFEVSRVAVTTGYLDLVCNMIADHLTKIPGDSRRQVAILTYHSGVQFYVLSGRKMRMVICQDLSEVILPDLNGIVNRINECAEPIINLLRQLSKEFANTEETSNCLGFVLQTALKLIGGTGGRVTVFNTSIPSVGPGALNCREKNNDLTKPEAEHLRPASDFYRTLALDFAHAQISVDLFMLNSNYCDIATISGVARFSGGGVYHYPNFHYDSEAQMQLAEKGDTDCEEQHKKKLSHPEMCDYVEVESLRRDLLRYLTRKIGFEAVLRLRCTRGLVIENFYGNFFMRSVDLLVLPVVNPDAGYAVQLAINENLDSFPTVVFQTALLYTSAFGERRIRVHSLCLPVTDSPEAIFNYADEGAVACLVAKMAVERTISSGLGNAREALTTVMGDILAAYQSERNGGSSHSSLSDICPASLRLLPSYLCGALRFLAFRNHISTSLDVRSAALELLIGASAHRMLSLLYPRMYSVKSLITEPACGKEATLAKKVASLSLNDATSITLPCLPLTGKSITRDGVFLLDTGSLILLLVGYGIPATDLQSLIGYSTIEDLTVEKALTKLGDLPEGEKNSQPRKRLQALIKSIQRDRSLGTALILIRHDVPEPLKSRFINALVEDRTTTAPSYSEYIQMILSGRS